MSRATTAPADPRSFLDRHVPLLHWLSGYRWGSWLQPDLIAGVSVAALLVPESLGYAGIAGLPPEVGLYAAPPALLAYAVLGGSKVLVVAASSSTAAVSASVIAELNANGNAQSALALSAALALFTGIIFVVAGLVRLGWVANFMSKTVIEGFIIGLSINIIIGQFDDLLGVDVVGKSALQELGDAVSKIGDWDRTTVAVGAASLALLFGLERFVRKLPAALTVVALAVLLVELFDPSLAVVGDIPRGLPSPGVPDFSSSQLAGLLAGGLAVALIGFSESYGAASSFARKHGDRLENNQEFIALGAANVGAGLTAGMVVGGSLSKTAANDSAGARTQLANVALAALVVLTLLFLAPLFESLPRATLAAVVIHALWNSADPRKLEPVWRVNRREFGLAVVVLFTVLVFDTLPAIVLGVVISLGSLVYRVSFPHSSELGRDRDTGAFENRRSHPDVERVPGTVVYRFEAPLIYANAGAFTAAARNLVDTTEPAPHTLVIDCEELFEIDFTGTEAVHELVDVMRERGVRVRLARVHEPVLDRLRAAGVVTKLGVDAIFPRVEDAV